GNSAALFFENHCGNSSFRGCCRLPLRIFCNLGRSGTASCSILAALFVRAGELFHCSCVGYCTAQATFCPNICCLLNSYREKGAVPFRMRLSKCGVRPMRKSVLGIFTVAALAASVVIEVAAAQRRDDGSRRAGGAAISGGAETTQPTPPSGGGPGKLPSAGQIPAPTSAASKSADTVPATGMGKPPSAGQIPAPTSAASKRADAVPATGMGKPPSPTGEGPAATRSSANAAATGGQAMASSVRTTDRYSGTHRRGDRYSGR